MPHFNIKPMTEKEKAKEFFGKFFRETPQPYSLEEIDWNGKKLKVQDWDKGWTHRMCKNCALIAVDEIIKSHLMSVSCEDIVIDYWNRVKTELENFQP